MKKLLYVCLLLASTSAFAGARTNWATPTRIDITQGNGFMVYGAFGNANNCTITDRFYVKKEHAQYEKIYSAVLLAYTSKKQIRAYIHTCEPIGWYSVPETTYNILTSSGDFQIQD